MVINYRVLRPGLGKHNMKTETFRQTRFMRRGKILPAFEGGKSRLKYLLPALNVFVSVSRKFYWTTSLSHTHKASVRTKEDPLSDTALISPFLIILAVALRSLQNSWTLQHSMGLNYCTYQLHMITNNNLFSKGDPLFEIWKSNLFAETEDLITFWGLGFFLLSLVHEIPWQAAF